MLPYSYGMNRKWLHTEDRLVREFKFGNFHEAMLFVNKVAEAADESNHHPHIEIDYNKVKLVLWTHREGKVTGKDLNLAEKIDELKF